MPKLLPAALLVCVALAGCDDEPRDDRPGEPTQLEGERGGALTIADGPAQRDVYAYADASGSDLALVVMDGTSQVAEVPLDLPADESTPAPEVSWSEDGRLLAFQDSSTLYVVDATDGSVRQRACLGSEDSFGEFSCPASVTIWRDHVVSPSSPADYEGTDTDLVAMSLDDLDVAELLFSGEPGGVQWEDLRGVGDTLFATGSDSTRRGVGYRGGDPGVLYAFDAAGTATRLESELMISDIAASSVGEQAQVVVVDGGSGGACSYGFGFLRYDAADPAPEAQETPADMFSYAGEGDQEYGTLFDAWEGADGAYYATMSSTVCRGWATGDTYSEIGLPLSTWRLDDGGLTDTGERDVWSARDLPSGARLSLTATAPLVVEGANLPLGSLSLLADGATTEIAGQVAGISAPAPGAAAGGVPVGDAPAEDDPAYTTKCGSPPTFVPVSSEATAAGIEVTYEVRAVCEGGQWLNWSQIRVPLTVDGTPWLDAYFDYSLTPYWIPEDGTLHTLTYPYSSASVPYEQIRDAIEARPEVIVVPCEPGPASSDDSSVPSTPVEPADGTAIPASGDAAGDESEREESALEALQRIAAEDEAAVEALEWTAQLSSKRPGTRDDGIVYDTYDKILELHLQHRARYPSTLLVFSGDWPGSYGPSSSDYWVTLSGDDYQTTQPVIDWCHGEAFGDGDCWAKRLRRSGDPDDNTDHAPADRVNNR